MTLAIGILMTVLFVNAVVAFGFAFFWQVKVILTLYGSSDWKHAFGRFIAGEVLPELRRKWLKAIAYVVASYAALFLIAGLLQLFAPEYLP